MRSAAAALRRVPLPLWPILALLALYAVFYAMYAAQLVAFPFDVDQGEGYDAWSAWLIDRGQLPYSFNGVFPFYSSNYPPVWSYLVSIPMAWTGPGLAPARALSAMAGAAAAMLVGFAAWRLAGRNALAGLVGGGLFLASPYVFHTAPLARVNSTTLLFGLVAATLAEKPTRGRALAAAAALAIAMFTKPTAVDAVVGVGAAMVFLRPRTGTVALAVGIAMGLLALAAIILATGGAFWLNVVQANANPFSLAQLVNYEQNFATLHAFILVLAVAELVRAARRRSLSPWTFYFLAAVAMSVTAGKWGAGESYFLSAIATGCALAGAFAGRLARAAVSAPARWQTIAGTSAVGGALLLQGLALAHGPLSTWVPQLPDRGFQASMLGQPVLPNDLAAGTEISNLIQASKGPALSEDPSFAVQAGKPVVGNATQLRNLDEAGLWDPTGLVQDVRAHKYGVVLLDAQLYPVPVLQAIGKSYYLDRTVQMRTATYMVMLPGAD